MVKFDGSIKILSNEEIISPDSSVMRFDIIENVINLQDYNLWCRKKLNNIKKTNNYLNLHDTP